MVDHERMKQTVASQLERFHQEADQCMDNADRGRYLAPYAHTFATFLHELLEIPRPSKQEAGDCGLCGGTVYHRPNRPGEYDHECTAPAARPNLNLIETGKPLCDNCGKPGAHYAPPSIGERGFYVCEGRVTLEAADERK